MAKRKHNKILLKNVVVVSGLVTLGILTLKGCGEVNHIPTPTTSNDGGVADVVIEQAKNAKSTIGQKLDHIDKDLSDNGYPSTSDLIINGVKSLTPAQADSADEFNAFYAKNYGPFDVEHCYVVKISDGDTATCLTEDKAQVKIRFSQIDAPESKQDFGTVSKQALADMIFNRYVDLDVSDTDRYGRTIAEVYLDGVNINKLMVKNGHAWAYKEYLTDHSYEEFQLQAQKAGLGLWAHKNPVYPQDFRKQQAAIRREI